MDASAANTIDDVATASGLKFMLRALRYRNYRLFFLGQSVSLIGSWLTTTATSWLVYRIAEGNPMLKAATVLGVVRFAAQIPTFVVAPLAGGLGGRWGCPPGVGPEPSFFLVL